MLSWIRVDYSVHLCLLYGLTENTFRFSAFSKVLLMDFVIYNLLCWGMLLSCLALHHGFLFFFFYQEWILDLTKAFSLSIKMILWFLFMWWITFINLLELRHPYVSGRKPTWSCVLGLSLQVFYWELLYPWSSGRLVYSFNLYVPLSGFDIKMTKS